MFQCFHQKFEITSNPKRANGLWSGSTEATLRTPETRRRNDVTECLHSRRNSLSTCLATAESDEGGGGRYLLDDGTGVIELFLSGDFRSCRLEKGMYIMVVGGYSLCAGDLPMIKVHKLVDLSAFPDRESMWYLEVMEAFKLFYQPMFQH
ncbi:uncharacterized protein LOC142547546 [Primulina tabacum]|uniref:uncharacterized protein LOC142547546 n=1 Tax=Primulina tabacum TaxID=48773 RepID=UPI003F5A9C21